MEEELINLRSRVKSLEAILQNARKIAAEQAEDEGLWFDAVYISEAYLQHELRRLTYAIEAEVEPCQDHEAPR